MHFLALLVIFGIVYFAMVLPLFQRVSRRVKGRKFVIRLGTPWNFKDPEHRWDVLMSFISFIGTLAISLFVLDFLSPLQEVGS